MVNITVLLLIHICTSHGMRRVAVDVKKSMQKHRCEEDDVRRWLFCHKKSESYICNIHMI